MGKFIFVLFNNLQIPEDKFWHLTQKITCCITFWSLPTFLLLLFQTCFKLILVKLLFLQKCYKSNSNLNFLFVGEVTSRIISQSNVLRISNGLWRLPATQPLLRGRSYFANYLTSYVPSWMKRRVQSNVLRIKIEFGNSWKVLKVHYCEIGKSHRKLPQE